MRILAIDPGSEQSAFVIYDTTTKTLCEFGKVDNNDLMYRWMPENTERLVIEMIASYGMPVGKTVFETCVWIGRFVQMYLNYHPSKDWKKVSKVYRMKVKMHLCGHPRAKDGNIRQAIIDRYPAAGGGATPQIGTKKQPGPLYGVSKDVWAALGVAITYAETMLEATP